MIYLPVNKLLSKLRSTYACHCQAESRCPPTNLTKAWLSWVHLLQICHTVDSDAGQVSNCVEEKLADVFLMFPDYPAHNAMEE